MQLGMIGLGRMGANMVRRLLRGGHECVAYDHSAEAVRGLAGEGARAATTLRELTGALRSPRAIWMMVPAHVVDGVIADLTPSLAAGDILIDGGNSHYHDDIRRAEKLAGAGIHYVDVGTSGGVLGLGYCMMIGGKREAVAALDPIFATLSPGGQPPAAGHSSAEQGYLYCGPSGAGHFVKMVHNGIEYGLMAAYAEGLNVLRHADVGFQTQVADAETAPLSDPRLFQYRLDLAAITEVWRHGSIITSQLLDLTAAALAKDRELAAFAGRVADSGEGRWTIQAAIEEGVPAHVLAAALFNRYESRGRAEFASKVLSAMRLGFGGHQER
ncbi:MAG TPA: decarboxylating 6-phosphogluconate dehydrogenase [Steroidobacteraceae bacterium]|nr:decarboxylating 6-phosphogluconate dehydrogenase [Steroidobacteraceae bacterium]